jgi:hypothetical protein
LIVNNSTNYPQTSWEIKDCPHVAILSHVKVAVGICSKYVIVGHGRSSVTGYFVEASFTKAFNVKDDPIKMSENDLGDVSRVVSSS